MNTRLFLIFTIFMTISTFSQEIKIKKGELLLDDKAVAKVSDKGRVYSFSDLNGKPQFSAQMFNGDTTEKGWVEFKGENGNVKEVEFSDTTFSLNMGKILVRNALAQGLITLDGINEAKVNEFFQTNDRSLTEGRAKTKIMQQETSDKEDKITNEIGIRIDNAGKIWDKNKVLLGFIQRVNTGNNIVLNYEYSVYENNKIRIAKLNCTNNDTYNSKNGLKVITYDNKQAEILVTNNNFGGPLSEDKMADRMVKKLVANGYALGDMKNTVEGFFDEKSQTAENNAKSDSKNIYNISGYVIDKAGDKKEGSITIEFESINAKLGREKGIADITNYGGTVVLNVNGKDEFFKAKDGVKFCAGERCFLGTQGSEDSGTGNNSGSQLSVFGESQFFEIQSENDGNYVLNHVKNPQYYYLKLANQSKAIYLGEKGGFGKRKPEKTKKIFDDYVSCPGLDFSKYDTKTKEGIINILNDYQTTCKK
ncbi:hypothetical protein [Chryseobacterium sp. CBo1]|uniref:hypothetical protein n=1 Tax=Chryseobacterium sp. CBo1 TaxID=1869230 RepID=UPI0013F4C5FE|nr:hypothetical protein [Chryseobacterium sp. CBo1]